MQVEQIKPAVEVALVKAREATEIFLGKHGDGACCGFAWVTVHGVKLSTKVGKAFAAAGFSKAYGGGIQLWNPSKHPTQCINAKEEGAAAFVKEMRSQFPELQIYVGSRLD